MKKFILGLITDGILTTAVTGLAIECAITANPYHTKLNGVENTIYTVPISQRLKTCKH